MAKIAYQQFKLKDETLQVIAQAEAIVDAYQRQGFKLTIRQLYYQFVAKDLIPNNERSYKRIISIINKARLAGLIDWDAIEDRTREVESNNHWSGPRSMMDSAVDWYQIDLWQNQETRVVVAVEKEALAGVVEGVCNNNDVPWFCCRGYASQTSVHDLAMQFRRSIVHQDQDIHFVYLGDHDPSGIDMTRDLRDRFTMFLGAKSGRVTVDRIALNMDQIQHYNPPPNFAKETDSRHGSYREQFGDDCWELDALDPPVIVQLIQNSINSVRDALAWDEMNERQEVEREQLRELRAELP